MNGPRIGLLWPQAGSLWTAGTLYFENLLWSLQAAGLTDRVVVIEPVDGSYQMAGQPLPRAQTAIFKRVDPTGRAARALGLARRELGFADPAAATAARSAGVQVVFGDVDARTRFPLPWVGWIPDFQHTRRPDFFSAEDLAYRDRLYGRLAANAARVVVSSQDALSDFSRFSPAHAGKGRVLPFVSVLGDAVFEAKPEPVAARYHIDSPFVVVPNQWWRHKNHETAIRAASVLAGQGVDLTWVFTGALVDYRDASHVSRLLQLVSELGVRERVVVLGMLPRGDQLQLMRAAAAIVQPSLFEGWSTVLEDARSLGQRLVASDIPVHREQDVPGAFYFDPESPEALAEQVVLSLGAPRSHDAEAQARLTMVRRAKEFGERFYEVCTEAAGGSVGAA